MAFQKHKVAARQRGQVCLPPIIIAVTPSIVPPKGIAPSKVEFFLMLASDSMLLNTEWHLDGSLT